MDILKEIIAHKRQEVDTLKEKIPVSSLEKAVFFQRKPLSMRKSILKSQRYGIIAEVKRKSPSKGIIKEHFMAGKLALEYDIAGAAAVSILTDEKYFGGSNQYIDEARNLIDIPILRKDFVVDEYQVLEAKAIGADAILLIAAALSPSEINALATLANSLGLEVLLEVHNEIELMDNAKAPVQLIGVNNRNLKTFEVTTETSLRLVDQIPEGVAKISESGLNDPATLIQLKKAGFHGFLIGEFFMQQSSPGKACSDFINLVKGLDKKA